LEVHNEAFYDVTNYQLDGVITSLVLGQEKVTVQNNAVKPLIQHMKS